MELKTAFTLGLTEIRWKTQRCHKNVYDQGFPFQIELP